MESACPLCGAALSLEGFVPRKETCPGCGKDLHACHACRFFDPRAHNQCREPKAEWQTRRDKANFCDFFELATGAAADPAESDKEAERKRRLDDLFKNL
jgi:hypothetical protein